MGIVWYNIQVVKRDDKNAGMAQLAEHVIGNDEVISSNLITSSKNPSQSRWIFCFFKTKRTAQLAERVIHNDDIRSLRSLPEFATQTSQFGGSPQNLITGSKNPSQSSAHPQRTSRTESANA